MKKYPEVNQTMQKYFLKLKVTPTIVLKIINDNLLPSCLFLLESELSTKVKGFPVNKKTSRAYAISSGEIKEIDVPDIPALATRPEK